MESEWTTAQIALTVSFLSFALALASFVWSVWSKFIFPKPNMIVRTELLGGLNSRQMTVPLEGANQGPTDIVVWKVVAVTRYPRWWSSLRGYHDISSLASSPEGGAPINHDSHWPRRLAVGDILRTEICAERLQELINYKAEVPLTRVLGLGYLDSFERFHTLPEQAYKLILQKLGVEDGQ